MAGMTSDNIEALDILTYDGLRMRVGQTSDEELAQIISEGGRRGDIYARLKALRDTYADLIRERFPQIPRRVSGYNLDQLLPENGFHVARALVGTEGTCITVLEATVRLIDSPPARTLLVLGFSDAYLAADHVPEIMAHQPIALEGFDLTLIENMRKKNLHPAEVALLPPGGGWLLVEFGSQTREESLDQARLLFEMLQGEVLTDGFSCREQIAQTTDRRALHLAQVIQLAMQQDEKGVTKEDAETPSPQPADQAPSRVGIALIGSIGLVLLGALLWIWGRKKRGEHLRENSNHKPV
jgi:FAD/FMN-containing dehydrogenase